MKSKWGKLIRSKGFWKLAIPLGVIATVLIVVCVDCNLYFPEKSFEGDVSELKATTIVPSMDTPIMSDGNIIWCATTGLAWKKLNELNGEPVELDGGPTAVSNLNSQTVSVSPELATTNVRPLDGIIRIETKMTAQATFPIPYRPIESMQFKTFDGKTKHVRGFGLRKKDEGMERSLRDQAKVLWYNNGEEGGSSEYALDLCQTGKQQVIVARMKRGNTLQKTWEKILERIRTSDPHEDWSHPRIGANDHLRIPIVSFRLKNKFDDLDGRKIQNGRYAGKPIQTEQEIDFTLDRNGASLTCATLLIVFCGPREFIFDEPFVIVMKERDKDTPYFMAWIENEELLLGTDAD